MERAVQSGRPSDAAAAAVRRTSASEADRGRRSPARSTTAAPSKAASVAGDSVATLVAASDPPKAGAVAETLGAHRLSSGKPDSFGRVRANRWSTGGGGESASGLSTPPEVAAAKAEVDGAADAYEEQLRDALTAAQESALLPMKEDVADWLSRLLGVDIGAVNLMELLQDGTLLCKLALLIDSHLQPATHTSIRFHSRAPAGSFLARDNAASFLSWARDFGVETEWLFESDGLVLRKDPRRVLLCILGVARIASSKGVAAAPALVMMEQEIREAESKDASKPLPQKTKASRPPSGAFAPTTPAKMSPLDSQVARLTALCRCPNSFQSQKVDDGVYLLGGKQCLVRLLRDRHVMVRVGGGWDSLEHYLLCHDSCRMLAFRREGALATPVTASLAAPPSKGEDRLLYVKGRYKSSSGAG